MATEFEFTVPVLIVGGGAAGCAAALAACDAGVTPLLVEQDARPAGSTSMSQGLICAAGTASQRDHDVDDDADRFYDDILTKTRGLTDPRLARTIAAGSGPCLDWLVQDHGLPWELDTGFRAAYGHSRLRVHGWRGRSGDDMIQLMHSKVEEAGADVLLSARLTRLVGDETGRVLGAIFARADGSEEAIGCEALVLASGGFAANHEAVARYMPEAAVAKHNGHEGNRGDALWLGAELGGALADMGSYQGYAMLTDPQGVSVPPGVIVEGGVLVNTLGERFVNEIEDIAGMVHPVMAQPDGQAWVVFDARIEDACAYIPETITLKSLNAAKEADTIEGLAAAIGVDAASLTATLTEAMDARLRGGTDTFGRNWSDDASSPQSPFKALKVCGALYHTQGGLQIDDEARVLREDWSRLPNLFAAGGAARGVSGPSSWGYLPAMGLCAAVTLGRIAGQAAAGVTGAGASTGVSGSNTR